MKLQVLEVQKVLDFILKKMAKSERLQIQKLRGDQGK